MKRRVHTWLIVVAGAIGLPLLAMCALQRAGVLEPLLATATQLVDRATAHAQGMASRPAAPEGIGESAMSQATLMSCADPEPVSTTPLWCEDHGEGARCTPAAPERSSHDLGAPSPLLASAPITIPTAPAVLLAPAPRRRCAGLGASRGACTGVERPPRA